MRYRVDGYTIRSENAARPASQSSGYVTELLGEFLPMDSVLDFGCGKLRYAVHLREHARKLTLVDSEVQLSRRQMLCGESSTIRDFVAEHWPGVRVINHVDFRRDRSPFDFILCANVLSAIPHNRRRRAVVKLLAGRLKSRGRCLFTCQYTNSYFCAQMADKKVKKYADGFIKGRADNATFYGLIKPLALRKLVQRGGMRVERTWIHNQSCYVTGKRS